MTTTSRVDTRHPLLVGVLRVAVSTVLLAGTLAVGALLGVSTVTAAPLVSAESGPSVSQVLPTPAFPGLDVPRVPLPTRDPEPVRYTCEPWANARFDDPAHPNHITNKACPELNAAREQAQREFRDAQLADDDYAYDERESTCSDPSSSVYGTAACGGDLDSDGPADGTDRPSGSG